MDSVFSLGTGFMFLTERLILVLDPTVIMDATFTPMGVISGFMDSPIPLATEDTRTLTCLIIIRTSPTIIRIGTATNTLTGTMGADTIPPTTGAKEGCVVKKDGRLTDGIAAGDYRLRVTLERPLFYGLSVTCQSVNSRVGDAASNYVQVARPRPSAHAVPLAGTRA
jgi:hypothetical protein